MSHIQLDIPNTVVVVREPSTIIDRSKIPIQSIAEIAISASYATFAKTIDVADIGIVGDISASGAITASSLYVENAVVVGGPISGLISSASLAQVALTVLQNTFTGSFTGSFVGNGSELIFTQLNTDVAGDSILIVGNRYNNYEYTQTTVFKKANVVVSGSMTVGSDGMLILEPRISPSPAILGGLFFSSSGELYVGI